MFISYNLLWSHFTGQKNYISNEYEGSLTMAEKVSLRWLQILGEHAEWADRPGGWAREAALLLQLLSAHRHLHARVLWRRKRSQH